MDSNTSETRLSDHISSHAQLTYYKRNNGKVSGNVFFLISSTCHAGVQGMKGDLKRLKKKTPHL